MVFRGRLAWMESLLKYKMPMMNDAVNHTFIFGASTTGKTYFINWAEEYALIKGYAKIFLLNCYEKDMLEEALTFMFPNVNSDDLRKMKTNEGKFGLKFPKPQPFNVKVYVPISENAPDNLPENFVPFSIPVYDFDEKLLQILYGTNDITKIKSIYDTEIAKYHNIGYADLKNRLRKYRHSSYFISKGFMGADVVVFGGKGARKTIDGFFNRLNLFNNLGILSSGDFEYNLKNYLRQELKDQKTIVVLYTGFLKNRQAQYFAMAYFMKCLYDLMVEEGMMHDLNYKLILEMEEIRFLFPQNKSQGYRDIHSGMSDLANYFFNKGRHGNLELWMICHSPYHIDPTMMTDVKTKIVTCFPEKKDREWLAQYFKTGWKGSDLIDDVMDFFEKRILKRDYRFLIIGEKAENVIGVRDFGFFLPRPRLSFYGKGKVPLDKDYSILKHDPITNIDLNIGLTDAMAVSKQKLYEEFSSREKQVIDEINKVQEELVKKEKIDNEEELNLIKKISELYNDGISLRKIADQLEISRDKVKRRIKKAIRLGYIEKEETGDEDEDEKTEDELGSEDEEEE